MRRLLIPVAAILGIFFAYPLFLVLQFASGDAWEWLVAPYARSRIAIALQQAVLSLALVLAVAVPLAVMHHKRSIPRSRFLLALHAAPFVLPVFVIVGGLQATIGANGWLQQFTGLNLIAAIGPLGAVVLANAYYNTGLAARLLHTSLERRPRALEEAAALLGAPASAVARRVTIPLLAPSFLASALLVFLFCLGSFGVVLFLGQGKVDTLDTLLYANLRGGFPRLDRGAVLAITQVVFQGSLLLGVLLLERRASRYAGQTAAKAAPANRTLTLTAWALALLAVLPLIAVLTGGFQLRGEWSLLPWKTLLDANAPGHLYGFHLGRAIGWSLFYALAAVLGSLGLTACLAYAARRGKAQPIAEALAALPLGTSSIVLGFGFLLAFAGRTWLPLFGSPVAIIAAHTLLTFPFTARIILPALRSLDTRLDDAAQVLGASRRRIAWRIHIPQLRRPLAAAAAFAAVLSFGDYGASLLLMTDNIMSLAVWTGQHGGPASFDPLARAQSTALAGVLLVLSLAALLVIERTAIPRKTR